MKQKVADILDLNTINIILGRSPALFAFFRMYELEEENKAIKNKLVVLPYGTYHHTNYEHHFKGTCVEYLNPIIVTQNREFLNTCVNTSPDPLGVVSYDFNIVQLSYDETEQVFKTNIITKTEAQKMLKENPDLELRDF